MEHALGKSDGTTLLEHIEDCLGVYSQLKNTLPSLPDVASLSNFWELLFYIIYFHDWGKCHTEFQKVLKGVKANFWNYQRHEIYSVPFVDKLNLNDEEKILIQRAIIGHHKTFFELIEKLKSEEDLELEYQLKWKRENKYNREYHPENFIENLRHNLNYDYLKYLIKNFGDVYQKFTANARKELTKEVDFQAQQHPVKSIAESTHKTVFHPDQKSYWQNILLWGSTKICDHYGSAKIKKINSFTEKDFNFLSHLEQKLKKEGQGFYSHQKKCFEKTGNCILIAPTGSGKTEAAIGWLKKQICESQGRAYYILPYTASINAMHQRLTKDFSKETEVKGAKLIGIQHGKLTQYIASLYEETGEQNVSIMKRNDEIKNLRDLYKKMIYPLKIATPFQVLKYCYGVKGFEMGFTELVGAKLIFDEIHAYDEITFAQILTGLQYFIKHFKCKVMVMTATLPSFMLNELQQVLEVQIPIKADSNLLKKFNRHRIEIKEGIIFDQIEKIKFLFEQKKRLIIVCNTVKTAQEIFTLLKESVKISENEIALLHSRFNSLDRNKKEKQALNPNNKILIGTQAIEVSLDIDYDVMFTEPAPLDALLQRFGRVNRRRKKVIATIYVSKIGGKYDHYIYPTQVVERTLNLLEKLDIIHEDELQNHLDFVYPSWEKRQLEKYNDTRIGFHEALKSLQPYAQHKENEEEFYEKFDGIQILPAKYLMEYKSLIKNLDFISAERLLVTIHRGMYFKLKNNGQIENHYFAIEKENGRIYKKYITIAKCKYNSETGMSDEFEEISDDSNII